MTVTVKTIVWRHQPFPAEGWVFDELAPRRFQTRFAADLYVTGMEAADREAERRRGFTTRTEYEIIEDANA